MFKNDHYMTAIGELIECQRSHMTDEKRCIVVYDDKQQARSGARWMVVFGGVVVSRHKTEEMALKVAKDLNERLGRQGR